MKALINPAQDNLVVQVEPDSAVFEVAGPLEWVNCPDHIKAYQYKLTASGFVEYIMPVTITTEPTKAELLAQIQALVAKVENL